MRYLCLIFIVLFLTTCSLPEDRSGLITFEDINYVRTPKPDKSTPKAISIEKFPEQDQYTIRTRVVIEYIVFTKTSDETPVDEESLVMMYGVIPTEIASDFAKAEEVYSDLGLKFEIEEISFRRYDLGLAHFFVDAIKYRDTMTVYYILPHAFPYVGLSSAPWEVLPQGILLSAGRDERTLAHEIGHYFGLLHTFYENGKDFCKDTVEQKNDFCESEFPDVLPNCRNIMNYCSHSPVYITKEQINRMRRFLRANRQDHIKKNENKYRADIEKMYNDLLEVVIPRYETPNDTSDTNQN